MMDFVFCLDRNFLKGYCVLMLSILRFAPSPSLESLRFHVLSDDLDDADKVMLKGIALRREGTEVLFYSPAQSLSKKTLAKIDETLENRKAYTRAGYYRLLIADLIPKDVHRALYLDGDMLCTGRLDELFSIDLKGSPVGMCLDVLTSSIHNYNRLDYPLEEGYFNAGVTLFDLDLWRKENLTQAMFDYFAANTKKLWCHDQDVINAVLHGRIFPLDLSYNVMRVSLYVFYWLSEDNNYYSQMRLVQFLTKDKWPALRESVESPRLVHFTWGIKPWYSGCDNPFAGVWRYFYSMSPWKGKRLKPLSVKARIKLLGRKALERLSLVNVANPPFPEEAWQSAQRVLDKLREEDARK